MKYKYVPYYKGQEIEYAAEQAAKEAKKPRDTVRLRRKYARLVRAKTDKEHIKYLVGSDMPRVSNTTLNSRERYVLDHKISIYYGFKHGISVEDLSHVSNLQFITGYDNGKKGTRNDIDHANRWILDKYR